MKSNRFYSDSGDIDLTFPLYVVELYRIKDLQYRRPTMSRKPTSNPTSKPTSNPTGKPTYKSVVLKYELEVVFSADPTELRFYEKEGDLPTLQALRDYLDRVLQVWVDAEEEDTPVGTAFACCGAGFKSATLEDRSNDGTVILNVRKYK